ncbi:MAG: ATP-binding protein [Pseudomonadota bacterium]
MINPIKSNSFFLFGARGTGKTTLLRSLLDPETCLFINLLEPELEDDLNRNPEILGHLIDNKKNLEWVFIDEIQKLPKLLNVVHDYIEKSKLKFALTGSSARKLKRGASNLLAGRAFVYNLYSLAFLEIGDAFDLDKALKYGTLPKIFDFDTEDEIQAFLRAYALTYLKEEIKEEQLVRKLDPFRRFLDVAAQMNGEIINFSNIAKDVGTDVKTVQSYFEILEDTLIGHLLEPFSKSIRKRQRSNPKFYFFDNGVKRALDRTLTLDLAPKTFEYGIAFEQFIINEMFRLNSYESRDWKFSYLRTKDDAEIDLIIERPGKPIALIEIKSTEKVDERHIRNLVSFNKDIENSQAFCISKDPVNKKIMNVDCIFWKDCFEKIMT